MRVETGDLDGSSLGLVPPGYEVDSRGVLYRDVDGQMFRPLGCSGVETLQVLVARERMRSGEAQSSGRVAPDPEADARALLGLPPRKKIGRPLGVRNRPK